MFKFSFLPLVIILTAIFIMPISAAQKSEVKVSPALDVLAFESKMIKTGISGDEITFSADDFERVLNVSNISSITLSSLPEKTDGTLFLGSYEVSEGMMVSRANIGSLRFVFSSENIGNSSFRFKTNHGAYDITCSLRSVDSMNYCPTLSAVSDTVLEVSTYKNVEVFGKLWSHDPEGDSVVYEIVSYPENGRLTLQDSKTGVYCYTPDSAFVGNDSFCYVAIDEYGNYSESAQVTLKVDPINNTPVFSDLKGTSLQVAAMKMTEQGIMSSTTENGVSYFNPYTSITRLDFLSMAMKTMGIKATENCSGTIFDDDGDIPANMKGYVDAAQRLGYVCGTINDKGMLVFSPGDSITVSEAAVILSKMTEFAEPLVTPVFADMADVPAWARTALYTMNSVGVFADIDGYINATDIMTREKAAEALYMLQRVVGK